MGSDKTFKSLKTAQGKGVREGVEAGLTNEGIKAGASNEGQQQNLGDAWAQGLSPMNFQLGSSSILIPEDFEEEAINQGLMEGEDLAVLGVTPTIYKVDKDIDFGGLGQPSSTNAEVNEKLNKLTFSDMSPNTVLSTIHYKSKAKLESVGIYKTIDLVSEGPIAGFCDAKGNLIGLSANPEDPNLEAFKGIYFNDMPVKNTNNGTYNYQRVDAQIRYGIANQPLLPNNSKQAGLSYLKSCQTFNLGLTLPGLNRDNWNRFASRMSIDKEPDSISLYANIKDDDAVGYAYMVWNKSWGKMDGPAAQFFLLGLNANKPSIYTTMVGKSWLMINKIREVFGGSKGENVAGHPVIFHHAITNDNVTNIEINLQVSQLFLRKVRPSGGDKPDGPIDNTIIFLIKVGYEDSDHLIGNGGDTYYVMAPITGLATSDYARSYNLPLPVTPNDRDRVISICVVTEEPSPEMTALGGIQRIGGVQSITEVINAPLSYPHSALIATLIDARSFNRVPKRTFDLKLIKVNIPSNYDAENKAYTGNWTGEFALNKKWTNNPAWVFYDMIVSKRYGLAKYGFNRDAVDKWNLYSIGKYCDELVETGYEPQDPPLDFTIDENAAVITIQDDPQNPTGFEELKAMFPTGDVVSLYRLKNKSGKRINQGFRRRIGARSYNEFDFVFKFNIHKIINPGHVFETYRFPFNGSETDKKTGLRYQYDRSSAVAKEDALSGKEWLLQHLLTQGQLSLGERDTFSKDYGQGLTLGNGVAQGKVVVESSVRRPVLEARFATNIYLDKEQEAYNCLNDLAAVFRGMTYWNNGFVFISNDQARDAVMVFTNANVSEGAFTYSGSSKTTRFTSVLIRYNDEHDNFKPKVEYIEDPASIRKYGHLEKTLVGLGTTSRSQAYRLGKWFLFTNQLETDLVQFKTGIEATYLRPGDVVKIQDSLKTAKRYGGRIKNVDSANFQLTLDKGIEENIVGQKITLIVPRDSVSVTQLSIDAQEKLEKRDISGMSQTEIDKTRAPQIKQFTIAAVGPSDPGEGGVQNDLITVEVSEDFGSVAVGTIWSIQNLNTKYRIKEVEYRILSVVEQTAGEYTVTAMMYAGSKFGAIDESRNLMATQQSMPQLNTRVVLESESLDASVVVAEAKLVPVDVTEHIVGDANDARDEALLYYDMFSIDFTDAANKIEINHFKVGGKYTEARYLHSWLITVFVGGRMVNQVTTKYSGGLSKPWLTGFLAHPWPGYKPPATKVKIWIGDRLDVTDVSYELTYSVIAMTHDKNKSRTWQNENERWRILSYSQPVLTPDGDERFDIDPGG